MPWGLKKLHDKSQAVSVWPPSHLAAQAGASCLFLKVHKRDNDKIKTLGAGMNRVKYLSTSLYEKRAEER